MEIVKKGSWVRIHGLVLPSEQRAENLPEDTKRVPLEKWNKGFLLNDAKLGEIVKIKTLTGREEEGKLIEVNHSYKHNYGDFVPEILNIGISLKNILREES